jgi:ABC-type antimicrobial peptide transport system permease subunit
MGGAGASDLLRLVLSRGLALTARGVVLGAASASACVVITIASFAACFVSAWRATRTDPLRALRG